MNKKTNLKIGILDNNGIVMNPISGSEFTVSSLLTPTNADGEWHRMCYSFLSPIDGYVYFYIEGSSLDIDLDEISLFRNTQGYDEDPNMFGKIINASADIEMPYVSPFPNGTGDDNSNIDDNTVIDNSSTDNKNSSNNVKKGKETNIALIIIGFAAAAAVIAGVTVLTVIIKRRNGKKA